MVDDRKVGDSYPVGQAEVVAMILYAGAVAGGLLKKFGKEKM